LNYWFPFFEDKKWLKHFDIDKWIFSYVKSLNTLEKAKTVKNRSIKICWDDNIFIKLALSAVDLFYLMDQLNMYIKDQKLKHLIKMRKTKDYLHLIK
jgi:hypothetical protein